MPRVAPLYYHYSNEPSICDAFDNTHVQCITSMIPYISLDQYLNPNLNTIPICKICVSFAVQYMNPISRNPETPLLGGILFNF